MYTWLKRLFTLQQYYKEIEANNKMLKENVNVNTLKKLKGEFENLKVEYMDLNTKIKETKNIYISLDKSINLLKQQLKKDEYILYNEAGSNIKLIEKLQQDIKVNKDKIQLMDEDSIKAMIKEEKLIAKMIEMKKDILSLRDEFNLRRKEYKDLKINCKGNVENAQMGIKKIEKVIPIEILNEFNRLRNGNGIAICKIHNGICDGCKIAVSCQTLDNIRRKDEVTYCDNCGRILYREG